MGNVAQHPAVRTLPYRGSLNDAIEFEVSGWCGGLCFRYSGSESKLVARDIVTVANLEKKRGATKYDRKGEKVHIGARKAGRCTVRRYRGVDEAHELPGFQPWMAEAFRLEEERAHQRHLEWERKHNEEERQKIIGSYPSLNPDEWRQKRTCFLRDNVGGMVIAAAERVTFNQLHADYLVHEDDLQAYRTRAQAVIDELAGMLSRVRTVRATLALKRLRLVVDNTRGAQP